MFYHIVNYHHIHNGYDDGVDCKMFNEAKAEARKSLLVDNPNFMYCEKVFVTTPMGYLRPAVYWVFDKDNLNGRRPHKWEIESMIAENYREEYLQNSPYIEKEVKEPPAGSVMLYRSKEYWKSPSVKKMKREEKLQQLERAEKTARELKDGGEMSPHVFGATMRWINQERKKLVAEPNNQKYQDMKEHFCSLEFLLNIMRGYYHIIEPDKRPTLTLSDGCGDSKTTKIKSIVAVDENCGQQEAMTRLKCIDVDDEMWDVEEYLTQDDMRMLCKAIKLPDDIDLPF